MNAERLQVEPCAGQFWAAAVAAKRSFFKVSRRNFVLSSKFSDDFLVIENCNKITTQQQWQIVGGGTPINKSRRRRPQIVGVVVRL